MNGLQTCLFKYIIVAAFHIYAQHGEDAAEREVGGHALHSHGNYIVDYEKSWNCVLNFCGNPVFCHLLIFFKINFLNKIVLGESSECQTIRIHTPQCCA